MAEDEMKMKNQKAFTLIELLVVIGIVIIPLWIALLPVWLPLVKINLFSASEWLKKGRGDFSFLNHPAKKRGVCIGWQADGGVVAPRGGFGPPKVQRFWQVHQSPTVIFPFCADQCKTLIILWRSKGHCYMQVFALEWKDMKNDTTLSKEKMVEAAGIEPAS